MNYSSIVAYSDTFRIEKQIEAKLEKLGYTDSTTIDESTPDSVVCMIIHNLQIRGFTSKGYMRTERHHIYGIYILSHSAFITRSY